MNNCGSGSILYVTAKVKGQSYLLNKQPSVKGNAVTCCADPESVSAFQLYSLLFLFPRTVKHIHTIREQGGGMERA